MLRTTKMVALLAACALISTSLFAQKTSALSARRQRPHIGIDPVADYVIPMVYDGGGYSTSFFLTNRDSKTLHLAVYFNSADGAMLTLPIQGLGWTSGVAIDLDVNQSATFRTSGESASFVDGYALVFSFDRPVNNPDPVMTSDLFSGHATFMKNQKGTFVEALVPISSGFENISAVAFDNRGGYSTAVVLVNTDYTYSTNVTLTIRDPDGNLLQRDTVTLGPDAKQFIALASQYPATDGQSGRVFISGDGPYLSPIGFRVNSTGGFTTLLPWSVDSRLMP